MDRLRTATPQMTSLQCDHHHLRRKDISNRLSESFKSIKWNITGFHNSSNLPPNCFWFAHMYRCSKFRHNYPKALARKDFTYSLALKGTPSSSFLESKAGYVIFFAVKNQYLQLMSHRVCTSSETHFAKQLSLPMKIVTLNHRPFCSHVFSCENSIGGLKSSFRRNKQSTATELGSEWVARAVANS